MVDEGVVAGGETGFDGSVVKIKMDVRMSDGNWIHYTHHMTRDVLLRHDNVEHLFRDIAHTVWAEVNFGGESMRSTNG